MSIDGQARYRYNQSAYGGANMPVQQQSQQQPTMSSQRFCLRWNNHQSNLLSVFDQLLHDESFVDVTLAVEGQLLRAHKMVLSACSPYFQALFVGHPDKHPIVILKDVPYADMKSLLDFMYRGEVSVDQERLTAFLRVAESLRIKGLTEVNEDKCDLPSITSSLLHGNNNNGRMNAPKRPPGGMQSPSLLSNALAQPKRKRGRPRKLSGSSNGSMKSDSDMDGEDVDDGIDEIKTEIQDDQPTAGTSRESENYNNEYQSDLSKNMTTQQKLNQKLLLNIKSEPNLTPPSQSSTPSDRMERQSPQSHQYPTTLEALSNYQLNLNPHHTALNLHHLMSKENNNNQQTPNIASTSGIPLSAPSGRQPVRRRARRRATSASQDPAEHLTEMSVRGLNLFRYASVSEGIYQCTECAKVDVQKTFKNKYSFQRHAFLYHEGHQRKVFPCPICSKEFSRPDKMKNHMKTVHDCFMPKECVFPPQSNFYSNPITSSPGQVINSNPATVINSNPSLM